jgi:hypothetical protein
MSGNSYNGNLIEGSAIGKPNVDVPRLYCSSERQHPSEIKVHGAAYQYRSFLAQVMLENIAPMMLSLVMP